jgi:oligoendopeptidase F
MTYKYNWDLEKYFYSNIDDPKLKKDLEQVITEIKNFIKKYKWKIKNFNSAKQLLEFYKNEESISVKLAKIFHYLFYLNSLDSQNQEVIKKLMEVENIFIQLQKELVFVDEEFKKLWAKKLKEFAQDPLLENYKYHILHKVKTLKYLLSEKEEKLLAQTQIVDSQIENLYNEFHNWLSFEIILDGKKKNLTEEEVRSLRSHKDPKIRRKAYKALRKVYWKRESKVVLSNLYSSFVKNWILNVKLRWYKTPIQVRNISENMNDKVVDMLINQVKEHYHLFQRYVWLKAKLLKKKLPLPIQDIFAPVVESKSEFTPEQAIQIHLDVMKNFDEDFYNYSIDLLKSWRVDFFPKQWKRWWAFASYSKDQESFVLLNFTKKLNDIFTLTHEFWHAIHGHLSQKQPEQVYDSPLSLAETASIFNEMLLSQYLLSNKELKKEDKIYLLENKLGDIMATIFRQIQYVDFELEIHNGIMNWKEYSHKDYCKIWREKQELMSWKTLKYDVPAEEETSWSMIPHIYHTPFYCYSYAFWNILSFSLYNKYKKEGKDFIKNYKEILSSGGSIPPKELLARYWIDISKKSFYQNAFKEIEKMLDELEKLI